MVATMRAKRAVQRIEPIILMAAVGFYVLAMTSQELLPLLEKKATQFTHEVPQMLGIHPSDPDIPREDTRRTDEWLIDPSWIGDWRTWEPWPTITRTPWSEPPALREGT
jgi:hypothetical protein